MKLLIEIIDEGVQSHYQSWKPHHKGDAGLDIIFSKNTVIRAGQTQLLPLGIKCWSPEGKSYYMYPRSSIYKTPLILANSVGIIDAGYTGELKAPMWNRNVNYIPYLALLALIIFLMIPLFFIAILIGAGWYIYNNYPKIREIINNTIDTSYTIHRGESRLQLCAPNLEPIEIEIVDKLPKTDRGQGGFGSTLS
jgi:dUTP diphosphatase